MDEDEIREKMQALIVSPLQALGRALETMNAALGELREDAEREFAAATTEKEVMDAAISRAYVSGAEHAVQTIVDALFSSLPA